MDDFDGFDDEGLYYIHSSINPNYSLTIQNKGIEPYLPLIISDFEDSFCQAFYFFKCEDDSYFIMNINSLKILGVEDINNNSYIIQNIISPLDNYKWEIVKTNNYNIKEYYIKLKYQNKRIDFFNNFAIVNYSNDFSQSQRFMFRKCEYNVPKSDLWQKWEIFYCREFIVNQMYIIRSAENDNSVINLDLYNNITLRYFNGNKEQIFMIFTINNHFHIIPFNTIQFMKNNFGRLPNLNQNLMNLEINKEFNDYNGNPLYSISNQFGLKLNTFSINNILEFNYSNGNLTQKFYFSLVTSYIFRMYISKTLKDLNCGKEIISLKYENILDYHLDGFRNIKGLSINKNTKYISDNVFKKIDTLKMIKINFEWINKFNQNNIISIEFNDNIYELNLNLLKYFINLNELHLPLTINNIIGSYVLNIPNLKILECDPKLLKYFNGINLDKYLIHKDINEIKMLENYTYLTNINAKILILFKNLKRIKEGIFDNSFFKLIFCNIHHVPFLNKSIVISIMLKEDDIDDKIYTNTFYNFINLKLVILPKNIKKIESKAFNNCKNLRYVKLPENCSDIRWDSFFKCDKCKIDCNDEIK